VTAGELHHIIPEVSKTTIQEAVTEKLGYRKLWASWVPKILTDDHKTKRMGSALKFLTRYAQEGDDFLDSIVAGERLATGWKVRGSNPGAARFSAPIQTGSGVHPTPCTMGTGSFPEVKAAGA